MVLGKAIRRAMASTVSLLVSAIAIAPAGHAEPADGPPPDPFPRDDLIQVSYDRVDPADFFVPGNYGVFFLSPSGLNCGIWLKGSFGCRGDITGLPPGENHIAWYNGDTTVHHDLVAAIQFPNVEATRPLPPGSYVEWNDTTCVTTRDNSTYCKRGDFRFLVTDRGTWLSPWYAPQTW